MIIRLHIIGGAGSGKSYIAGRISEKYNVPHYDLDNIFWDNSVDEYGVKAPIIVRNKKLNEIVVQPSWIIEGVYFNWLEPSLALADKIFILNTPLSMQEERIWSRHEKRKAGAIPSTKSETIKSVEQLIEWNRKYNQEFLPKFIRNNEYKEKMIQLENSEAIFSYLVNY
ncbi:MAG TPA: hypothetical protein VK085_13545 [Pseudogracilibacillus sp.]|nr:hypothetical protein [Pseudogracilibacillus sp.]